MRYEDEHLRQLKADEMRNQCFADWGQELGLEFEVRHGAGWPSEVAVQFGQISWPLSVVDDSENGLAKATPFSEVLHDEGPDVSFETEIEAAESAPRYGVDEPVARVGPRNSSSSLLLRA
jgi:hypothetical protein